MASIPTPPRGGARQRRAAKLRAEAESQRAGGAQEAQQEQQAQAADAQSEQSEDPGSTGPVGDGDHVVVKGECVSSIAKNTGHFWETIWNEPRNSEVKEVRQDPNVLLPGDRLTIPELTPKDEPGATEERHRFRRLGEPAKLKLRIMQAPEPAPEEEEEEDQEQQEEQDREESEQRAETSTQEQQENEPRPDLPRANVPYTLEIDGVSSSGQTDEEGYIEHQVPGNARRGRLIIEPGTPNETEIPLQLGRLDPISETAGVKQRLNNLAFDCGDQTDESTPGLEAALRAFQEKHGVEVTGKLNPATREMLREVHGS